MGKEDEPEEECRAQDKIHVVIKACGVGNVFDRGVETQHHKNIKDIGSNGIPDSQSDSVFADSGDRSGDFGERGSDGNDGQADDAFGDAELLGDIDSAFDNPFATEIEPGDSNEAVAQSQGYGVGFKSFIFFFSKRFFAAVDHPT